MICFFWVKHFDLRDFSTSFQDLLKIFAFLFYVFNVFYHLAVELKICNPAQEIEVGKVKEVQPNLDNVEEDQLDKVKEDLLDLHTLKEDQMDLDMVKEDQDHVTNNSGLNSIQIISQVHDKIIKS